MRIPKTWVPPMAKKVVEHLISQKLIGPAVPVEELVRETEAVIMEELTVEDRLNEEVKVILRKFEGDIDRGRLDYKKVFDLTKQKLVKERNIVL